jgi:hypothetical protein
MYLTIPVANPIDHWWHPVAAGSSLIDILCNFHIVWSLLHYSYRLWSYLASLFLSILSDELYLKMERMADCGSTEQNSWWSSNVYTCTCFTVHFTTKTLTAYNPNPDKESSEVRFLLRQLLSISSVLWLIFWRLAESHTPQTFVKEWANTEVYRL